MPYVLSLRPLLVARLLLLLALAGCGRVSLVTMGPVVVPSAVLVERQVTGCGQDRLSHLLLQPFTALSEVQLPGQLRVLRPGQGVTREVMHDRLNVQVNEAGLILRLFCG